MSKIFVVEVSPTTSPDGSTSTFLFSTESFATKPTDTPANVPVRAILKNPGTLRRELFSGARITGAISPSYGNIVLANNAPDEDAAGELDGWIDYGISGSRVVVRWGEIGDAYPSEWVVVYIAYAQALIADIDTVTIRLRDRLQLLDKPVVNEQFAGTGGLEGTGNVSKRKQWVSQDPGFIPPILVDPNKLIYFVQSTGVDSLAVANISGFKVYDNGVELTYGANYASADDMLANSPAAGNFRYWFGSTGTWHSAFAANGPVYFRLGSPPDGDLRVSAIGWPNDDDFNRLGAVMFGGHTVGLMALRAGLVATDLGDSAHSLKMLSQLIDDDRTYLDAMSDAAAGHIGGYFGFTRLDKFISGILLDPESNWRYYNITPGLTPTQTLPTTSVYTFNAALITNLRREPPSGMEAPVWSVAISAGEMWPSQIAGGADAEMKDYLTRQPWFASSQGVSTTALTANPGALTETIEIRPKVAWSMTATRLLLERYFALYGGRRDFFTFTIPMSSETLALELHDVVTLQTPRFGLASGKKFRIVGITVDCAARVPSMKFILWGGQPGRFTGMTGGPGTPGWVPPNTTQTTLSATMAARNSIGVFTGWMAGTVSIASATGGGFGGSIGDFSGYMLGQVEGPFCTPDPYYSTGSSDPRTALSIHADTDPPVDQSGYQTKTLTLTGSASISTSEAKFGGKSILVPNAGTSTLNGLVVTDHADFDFGTGDFTIDLWAYRSGHFYVGTLFYGTLGGGEFSVKVGTDGLIDLIYRSSGGSQSFTNVATWPIEEWVYFVTQRRGTNWETYLNGVLIHSAAITGGASSTVNSTGDLYFGRTNASSSQSWGAWLDDIRVTRGATRYANPNLPTAAFPDSSPADPYWDNVVLLLHFDGADGSTTFTDSSANPKTVTRDGAVAAISTSQSKFGGAAVRTATVSDASQNNGLRVAASSDFAFGSDNHTYEAWAFLPSPPGTYTKRLIFTSTVSQGIELQVQQPGGELAIGVTTSVSSVSNTSGAGAFTFGVWNHIAVCRDGSAMRVYVNGTQAVSVSISGSIDSSPGHLFIGKYNADGGQWHGWIDDFRITKAIARYPSSETFTTPSTTFCENT